MNCVICGTVMDPVLAPATTHPTCLFEELGDNPEAASLKQDLIEIIKWYDKQNPRSAQVQLGPSEIGDPCDRRIGYRLAGIEPVNVDFDPFPSIVGVALHSWLDEAVQAWCKAHESRAWLTETPVELGPFIRGQSDLYNTERAMVIDHKGVGPDLMKKYRKEGPPPGYVIQVHVYGLGYEQKGYPVKKVALAFYPRAGWLKDMYVWVQDYDRSIGQRAIDRMYRIAQNLISLDVLKQSHRWEQVPATPSNSCGFCPWYDKRRDVDQIADDRGCPGR
jgi:hypothetical protein